jgi:hypothetical protein
MGSDCPEDVDDSEVVNDSDFVGLPLSIFDVAKEDSPDEDGADE